MEEMRNAYAYLTEKTERKNNLGNTGVDEKKIFKIPVTGTCE
jgi:hypothetical protein